MPRANRSNLPGMPFHLTARIQGREPLFRGRERTVVAVCLEQAERADGQLLAYAVMPNHLHLVYVQGAQPLAAFMQPLLRRLALLLQRATQRTGHVFERRFRDSACTDPDYLRNAIAYVHLNAVRALICDRADDYAWSLHASYCAFPERSEAPERGGVDVANGLRLFAPDPDAQLAACRDNYLAFLEWRLRMDQYRRLGGLDSDLHAPRPPRTSGGDAHWLHHFSGHARALALRQLSPDRVHDLRDLARIMLRSCDLELTLDLLRSGGRGRPLVAVRNRFIARAHRCGFRSTDIARFLRVSETTVRAALLQATSPLDDPVPAAPPAAAD